MADDDARTSDPAESPVHGGQAAGGMPSPSGGDRTARTASELTDDPDPGSGSELDTSEAHAGEPTPEPPVGGG